MQAECTELLSAVASIADATTSLEERRHAILPVIGEVLDAAAGIWSWGLGNPALDNIVPVAFLEFGMSEQQQSRFMDLSFQPELRDEFQLRVYSRLQHANLATTLRTDLYTDQEWATGYLGPRMLACGWSEFLHVVRYSTHNSWSVLMVMRNAPSACFGPQQRLLAEMAMSGIPWLHSTCQVTLPDEALVGLTNRQRAVMLQIIDGQPRKTIARRLGISEATVGDHIAIIYDHFRVRSAVELAALFLRNK